MKRMFIVALSVFVSIAASAAPTIWNNPHRELSVDSVFYSAMTGAPKTLDPARSYTAEESEILAQIYEPVLQYDYLKRPYQLTLLTASAMPSVTCFDAKHRPLSDCTKAAFSRYTISLQPNIYYHPHPAFAQDDKGAYLYHHLSPKFIAHVTSLADFSKTETREVVAADYVYEIKRLASPLVQSPIFGVMSEHILGFSDFPKQVLQRKMQGFIDLRQIPLAGVSEIDRYHYQIELKGYYPQFIYWLAMLFFCPIPWEADAFYSQPGLDKHNISFAWYPVGTGPYYLAENDPNSRMVLRQNPNYHAEYYPSSGMPGDAELGYLKNQGQRLPFIKEVIFELDKESIPRWTKFLQGYYDRSGVSADSFDQAIQIDNRGRASLTKSMREQGIYLKTSVEPDIFYIGFNMKDPVVGGYSEQKRKLRQAISIALNYEEYISIFLNGRGAVAQGPIPRGIFGYRPGKQGIDPVVYDWQKGRAVRKPLAVAKRLLAEAGYPDGIDPKTKKALVLNYDAITLGGPDEKSYFDWLRKEFANIGLELNIRATLYNQFQDNADKGKLQIFSWGWSADYPDPENFLFLLYGPNGKVDYGGENASNYENPAVDRLFEEIRNLPNGPVRQQKIDELVSLVRLDAPWVFGFNPAIFVLSHAWMQPSKTNAMARNTLKYLSMDPKARLVAIEKWNAPQIVPLLIILGVSILIGLLLWLCYWWREHRPAVKTIREEEKP